jgi:predicted TIM-barrel fold metal-dependent hydrolase
MTKVHEAQSSDCSTGPTSTAPQEETFIMSTRRGFLGGSLSAGAMLALQGCEAMAPQTSKRVIVDAQIHLWGPNSPTLPWVPNVPPQMPEPFTIERALPLMDEAGVDRAIVVPPSWVGDRNDYALEAARRYPGRFAVMGRLPLNKPDAAAQLPKWKDQPGMLGVRALFLGGSERWLTDGTADWFWPAAEKAGLPVMVLAGNGAEGFFRVADRHPQLQLIIDHMGITVAAVRAGRVPEVIGQVERLARYPNVSVKLSAVPNLSSQPYPFADFYDHIQRLFNAYGPQRSYWGTDITNGFAKATYRQRVTHFTETLKFLSEGDKDWVMGRALLVRLKWA